MTPTPAPLPGLDWSRLERDFGRQRISKGLDNILADVLLANAGDAVPLDRNGSPFIRDDSRRENPGDDGAWYDQF